MTAERIDHVHAARVWIEGAERPDVEPVQTSALASIAQVHATLALVEQQRIANVISLMQMQGEIDENTDLLAGEVLHSLIDSEAVPAVPGYGPAGIDERVFVRPEIREALGLS